MTGWWRTQRVWLVALPVTLVLLVAASAYRFRDFYWLEGYHRESAVAAPGKTVRVADEFRDALGPTRRTFEVGLDRVQPVRELRLKDLSEAKVPAGTTALAVHLNFEAAPDQDLNYCTVFLVDERGVVYGTDSTQSPLDTGNACLPEDHEGPGTPITAQQQRGVVEPGHERPATWSVAPVVVVPSSVKVVAARVVFDKPDYVTLRVR